MQVATPLTVLSLACLTACAPSPTPPGPELEPRVRVMIDEGWNQGEVAAFDTLIADSVTFHYAGDPRPMARSAMGDVILRWREAFPDLHMALDEMISEDDLVAARMTLTGTHQGPWAGAEPTGRQVRMALTMFFRFEDGRMVELWESDDQLGFRRQLGLIAED